VFEPDMTIVQAQAAALVARAPLPLRDSYGWHSQIQKLLDTDDVREQKQRASEYPDARMHAGFGNFMPRATGLI
jgi:hypothetical protein